MVKTCLVEEGRDTPAWVSTDIRATEIREGKFQGPYRLLKGELTRITNTKIPDAMNAIREVARQVTSS